jgi:hypothetical protein
VQCLNDESNLVRKHTLSGMAGRWRIFLGVPWWIPCHGGQQSVRIEYFEHTLEAIMCGEVQPLSFVHSLTCPFNPFGNYQYEIALYQCRWKFVKVPPAWLEPV